MQDALERVSEGNAAVFVFEIVGIQYKQFKMTCLFSLHNLHADWLLFQ